MGVVRGKRTSVSLSEIVSEARPGFACGAEDSAGIVQFRMNNVTRDGSINWTKVRRVPTNGINFAKYGIQPGDILFNCTNSPDLVGKSAIFDGFAEPVTFSNHFLRIRVSPDYADSKFLARWIQLKFQQGVFRGMCRQWVNQATVTRENLLAMRVTLPPLAEQRRIAAILDQADALRSKRRISVTLVEALAQTIFVDAIGDPLKNPKGWTEDQRLGDVAEIVSGITVGRKLNGRLTRAVPYLAVVNVQDRELNLNPTKIIEATDDEINRYRLKRDDLLLTEGGDPDKLGRGVLWKEELPECIHQNHIFRVRASSDKIRPIFLEWLVGSLRGKKYFLRSAKQTTGIASINMTQLRNFPLLLPPVTVQDEVACRIASVDQQRKKCIEASWSVEALFASLQHRAFRGEL